MSELTKEYLDEKFKTVATKKDLERIEIRMNGLATKEHLQSEASGIHSKIDELEHHMSIKFDAIIELLDVRKDVEKLKEQVNEIREAMHLKA